MKKSLMTLNLFISLALATGCTTANTTTAMATGSEPAAQVAAQPAAQMTPADYDRDGFATRIDKRGHLWVFRAGSQALADYDSKGAPAVHNVRPLAGPNRITMKEAEEGAINAYLMARPGFATRIDKRGHLWVFKAGSQALADYDSKGAPAVHNVRPLAGPNRVTMKEAEEGAINAYLMARPGFATRIDKRGHLWVFKAGSQALSDYDSKGAPAVHNVRPLAGPNRITMKEAEEGAINAYLNAEEYK